MSLWTLIKLLAAMMVMVVMAVTGMLAYHVVVEPVGLFAQIIPDPVRMKDGHANEEFVKMLDSAELPDIDPGEKAFQKAHELLAMGKLTEAREKLTNIVNVFPSSASAPVARRMVGEMNLDEILSTAHRPGKLVHVVKRGDSFLGIAAKYNTTIDVLMHLNSMMELKGIQPGDEFVLMPLEFRLMIDPQRKCISLWDGGRFICEYPALHMGSIPRGVQRTTISSKSAESGGKRVPPQSKEYRTAIKIVQTAKPNIRIRGWDGNDEKPAGSILITQEAMEEISLLTRVGNEVEIR